MSQIDSQLSDANSITVSGETIYAFYTHGGSPAEVNSAQFTITNPVPDGQMLTISRVESVYTDREGKEIVKELSIKSVDAAGTVGLTFPVLANSTVKFVASFDPLFVSVFYYKSERSIRLIFELNGNELACDAELKVTRLDPVKPNDD